MLHNIELASLRATVLSELMPLQGKMANPMLWSIYEELEELKVAVELRPAGSESDHTADIVKSILKKLKMLPDRKLAREIARIIRRHTPPAIKRKTNHAACGRVVADWPHQVGAISSRGL